MTTSDLIQFLLKSEEPAIRWKLRVHVLGEDPDSSALRTSGNRRATIRMTVRAGSGLVSLVYGVPGFDTLPQ